MKIRLASPLFILRNEAEKDLFSVLERLRDIGFDGVEFLGFFGKTPAEIRKRMDALSLTAIGNHVGAETFINNPKKIISDHQELGCKYITICWPKGASYDDFDNVIRDIKSLSRKCTESGITPLYHNHAFEFETSPDMLDKIIDACMEDGLRLEPDLGWMAVKQINSGHYMRKYMDYCPVIHLKDINNNDDGTFVFRPTGYGHVNYPLLMPECLKCNPEWFVIDHDLAYERDSFSDLKISLEYIKNLLDIMNI